MHFQLKGAEFVRVVLALLAWTLSAAVHALPVPYEAIVGAPGNQSLGITWNANPTPPFVYSNPAVNPILYSFAVLSDQAGNAFGPPVPNAAINILKNNVLPTWSPLNGVLGQSGQWRQVMDPSLAAGELARQISPGEVNAYAAVYPNGASYRQWVLADQTLPNIVFAFADFSNQAVQNFLAQPDWPGKQTDANGNLLSWSQRSQNLQKDNNGVITGGPGGGPGDVPIDGVLAVWEPGVCVNQVNQTEFCPHDSALDFILFNSKVNWYFQNPGQNLGANQFDFYHVALHETGHDLGLDHAVGVPEPSSILLMLIAPPIMMSLHRRA